ncbi:MAG: PQQ-dependent sugar dehydrogenase [Acidimicrobiales bacterium]|nr:PQQ-dependent sugar dehydrogenase [Acidimicrobiales bacterium]
MQKLGFFIILLSILSACGNTSETSTPSQVSTPTTTLEVLQESDVKLLEPLPLIAMRVGEAEQPMVLISKPDGNGFLLGERKGQIKTTEINDDGSLSIGETLLDLSNMVSTAGEGGLLGMAFSKDGSELFINYTAKPMTSRVSSFPLVNGLLGADMESEKKIIEIPQPYPNHNGGHLLVDDDGYLLIGLGDGGAGNDPLGHGQDTSTFHGSILRVNPNTPKETPYIVPSDNPFIGSSSDFLPEIFLYGLRNPWRFDFDPSNGHLWIADVGQDRLEEVNLLLAESYTNGANFGWSSMEGTLKRLGFKPDANYHVPVHEYEHGDGRCSIIGGVVVRDGNLEGLEGAFVYSDLCDGKIRALLFNGEQLIDHDLETVVELPISFTRASDGRIYVLSATGGIFRLEGKNE